MRKGTAGERSRQAFWIGLAILVTGTLSFFYWAGKKQVWFCDEKIGRASCRERVYSYV